MVTHSLKDCEYYHGTQVLKALFILYEGFRLKARWCAWGRYGTFGYGVYLTKSFDTAARFGRYVFRCVLAQNARILRLDGFYDVKVIQYLRKEFGHELIRANFSKAIPVNFRSFMRQILVVYKQKHIDQPMSLLDIQLRQGGRYVYNYFDMDRHHSTVFPDIYHSSSPCFRQARDRLGTVHYQTHYYRYHTICRPVSSACSRRLPSVLPGFALGHQQTLANPDAYAGKNLLPDRHHYPRSGRYAVPPQRKKNQRCRLLAGCCPLDKEEHCLCVGTESCGFDIADPATLGRRTIGAAYQHEVAPKERAYTDRIGSENDRTTPPMAAREVISTGCRRLLCHIGWQTDASNKSCFAYTTQCKALRSAARKKKENQRQTSQERQTPCQPAEDGFVYSPLDWQQIEFSQRGKTV